MYIQTLLAVLPILSLVLAAPEAFLNGKAEKRNERLPKRAAAEVAHLEERQTDINQLLTLASIAGIGLPTDPAALLQLGPVAGQLASALPTGPVLSVLETAAPKSFISNIVNDPAYASSFEKDFSAGKSPDWFTALPSSVKSYLHTYKGFGELATDAAAVKSQSMTSAASQSGSTESAQTGSGSESKTSTTASETGGSSTSSSSGATPSGTAGAAGNTPTSSSSSAGAAQQTAVIGLGAAGVMGILGLAIAL